MSNTQQDFVLEVIAEARQWTKLRPARLTVSSAIRRRPAATSDGQSSAAPPRPLSFPACRDFPTWASYRDLWQWIQNFSINLLWFWNINGQSLNTFQGENKNELFSDQLNSWCWWTHFSRSLTPAALKGALVTPCRPLWGGLRISFQLKGNSQCFKKSEMPGHVIILQKDFPIIFGLSDQDFLLGRVSTAISPWIHQFSSDHWS